MRNDESSCYSAELFFNRVNTHAMFNNLCNIIHIIISFLKHIQRFEFTSSDFAIILHDPTNNMQHQT